jgi:DSF synthase
MQAASVQSLTPAAQTYENLSVYRDADDQALYFGMNVHPRPCFTWGVVRDILTFQQRFASGNGGGTKPRCLVFTSESPGIFSLGGDLSLFQTLIADQDSETLAKYADDCVSILHNHLVAPDVVTVSLLEGDALGAGFESALSSDIVIAERGIRAGFPEVLFNLVPGHGAFYLLARRIGPQAAEKMIADGGMHTAEELHAMGLVDILTEKGEGRQAVARLLEKNKHTWNAFQALQLIKRHHAPVNAESLHASAGIWVSAAMRLTPRNLRMMARLVSAQEKRLGQAGEPFGTVITPDAQRPQPETIAAVA